MTAELKPDDRQLELGFVVTRRIQLDVLNKVFFPDDWSTCEGGKERKVKGLYLKSLVYRIDDHARDGWCTASWYTIGKEAGLNVGQRDRPNTSHVRRGINILRERGFLIEPQNRKRGRNKCRLNWQLLIEFADLSDDERERIECEIEALQGQSSSRKAKSEPVKTGSGDAPGKRVDAPGARVDAPPEKVDAPQRGDKAIEAIPKTNLKPISRSREGPNRVFGFKDLKEEELGHADFIMDKLSRQVSIDPAIDQDWELLAKVAVLVSVGVLPEPDVAEALEAMRRNNKSYIGYFIGCMKRSCSRLEIHFGRLIAQTIIPPEMRLERQNVLEMMK